MTRKFVDTIIELKPSRIKGVGVFAARRIRRGEVVAAGIHERDYEHLVSWAEFASYDAGLRKRIMDFCVGTPDGFIPPDRLDFNELSVCWYMNHSCSPNVGFNSKGDFVAIRNVAKGHELAYDYGFADSNPAFCMNCCCGSRRCRGKVTGNDWRDPSFRAKSGIYMLPRLRSEPKGGRRRG